MWTQIQHKQSHKARSAHQWQEVVSAWHKSKETTAPLSQLRHRVWVWIWEQDLMRRSCSTTQHSVNTPYKPQVSFKCCTEESAWRCCSFSAFEWVNQRDEVTGGTCGALLKMSFAAVAVPLYVCLRVSLLLCFSSWPFCTACWEVVPDSGWYWAFSSWSLASLSWPVSTWSMWCCTFLAATCFVFVHHFCNRFCEQQKPPFYIPCCFIFWYCFLVRVFWDFAADKKKAFVATFIATIKFTLTLSKQARHCQEGKWRGLLSGMWKSLQIIALF